VRREGRNAEAGKEGTRRRKNGKKGSVRKPR